MSEVEKMYEKIGLASHICKYPRFCDDNNCNECPNYSSEFTAEKQLELIKWLITISDIDNIHIECENKICIHNILGQSDDCDTIEDALASYINDIWQDLTESEQEQIRRILK